MRPSRPYNYTMFLALLHTSSKYHLCSQTASNTTWIFALRVFCKTKSSNYGSETKFAHWAGSWFFHIELYYSQQIKGGSSPGRSRVEPPKLLQDLSELSHAPCRKTIATLRTKCVREVLYLGIAVVFWVFRVSLRHLLDLIHRQESKESMILLGALKIIKDYNKSIYTVHQYTVKMIRPNITSLDSVLTGFRKFRQTWSHSKHRHSHCHPSWWVMWISGHSFVVISWLLP